MKSKYSIGRFLLYKTSRGLPIDEFDSKAEFSSFASLSCGSALNIFFTSSDSTLLSYTTLAAQIVNKGYEISNLANKKVLII